MELRVRGYLSRWHYVFLGLSIVLMIGGMIVCLFEVWIGVALITIGLISTISFSVVVWLKRIEALRRLSLSRTLAEPNRVAINGQSANFQAGGQFPIPVISAGGAANNLQGVQFVLFGVQLQFSPIIQDRDVIRLQIRAEVSTRDEAEYRHALTIDRHYENAAVNLGLLLARQRGCEESLALLGPAIGESAAHHNLGVIAIDCGDEATPRQEFSHAASFPSAPKATLEFLAALSDSGRASR